MAQAVHAARPSNIGRPDGKPPTVSLAAGRPPHIASLLDTEANRMRDLRRRLREFDLAVSARAAAVASLGITVWAASAAAVLLRWVP